MRYHKYKIIFLLLRFFASGFAKEDEDDQPNSVVGDPFVSCAADAIYVKIRTNATFAGHINVRYTPNKYCYQVLVTNNQIEILIPHEECSVVMRRSLTPAGVYVDASVSVSFHPEFTTSDDRIFNLQCFHVKQNKGKGLEIGKTVEKQEALSTGPQCSYSVLSYPNGPAAGRVTLGQTVYHEWKCTQTKDTCLIVRNCALIGGESRHSVIHSDGCSKDTRILPDLNYVNETYISQNVSVFGVSSSSLVYFECELLLLPSNGNGQCQRPICGKNRTRRSIDESETILEVRSQRLEISQLDSSSIPSPLLPISDPLLDSIECPSFHEVSAHQKRHEEDLCLSISALAIIITGVISAAVLVIFIVTLAILQRYKHYNVAHN